MIFLLVMPNGLIWLIVWFQTTGYCWEVVESLITGRHGDRALMDIAWEGNLVGQVNGWT